jgi:hypothetical protein
MSGFEYNDSADIWTTPVPATRHTARYGVRRPHHNSYASVIYSQKTILPTDMTRVTSRDGCVMGSCSATRVPNGILETKESLCGDCYQPVKGPGQPAWRDSYDDSLGKLMVDSDLRDQLIRQAYRDIANQSNQLQSKPVLCKALARLYNHGPYNRLRVPLNQDSEDAQVQKWYATNCYPYVTAAGSVPFYEPPLPRKEWIDNIVRQLGPALQYMERDAYNSMVGCPCAATGERAVYPRKPTIEEIQNYQLQSGNLGQHDEAWYKTMYGLFSAEERDRKLREQQAALAGPRQLRDQVNQDYDQRVEQARVNEHRRQQVANAQRLQSIWYQ